MRIAFLTDIHGSLAALEKARPIIETCDLILLGGDLTTFGGRKEAEEVLSRLPSVRILSVFGNCDRQDVELLLQERQMSLHGRAVNVNGFDFIGCGGSLACPGKTPSESPDALLGETLRRAAASANGPRNLIAVAHQPPFGTAVDRLADGSHVGSASLRRFIEEKQPLLYLCGHIHESCGVGVLGRTQLVNPGPAGKGRLALISLDQAEPLIALVQ